MTSQCKKFYKTRVDFMMILINCDTRQFYGCRGNLRALKGYK